MVNLLVLAVLGVIGLPHLMSLHRSPPALAIALWVSALALRALGAMFASIWLVVFLPSTALFHAVTQWCWHRLFPLLAAPLGLGGPDFGDVAALVPALAVLVAGLLVTAQATRSARAVRRFVHRHALGPGPEQSVIVGGSEVVLAAAGLRRPLLVVSAGALLELDDEELAAGLAHERGHIARRHRFLVLFAEMCGVMARPIPWTRRAVRELSFHLERDADAWALTGHDRYALAGAICKAALSRSPEGPARAALGGSGNRLTERVESLVDVGPACRPGARRALRLLVVLSVTLALGVAGMLPVAVAAGHAELAHLPQMSRCPA